jgi:hypothetical protein
MAGCEDEINREEAFSCEKEEARGWEREYNNAPE